MQRGDLVSINQEVRAFLENELGRPIQTVSDQESLLEAGVIDSLGVVSLVSFIERQYGIRVDEEELMPENFDSVDAIVGFIAGKRGATRA
jgi:acyl carrier protein